MLAVCRYLLVKGWELWHHSDHEKLIVYYIFLNQQQRALLMCIIRIDAVGMATATKVQCMIVLLCVAEDVLCHLFITYHLSLCATLYAGSELWHWWALRATLRLCSGMI